MSNNVELQSVNDREIKRNITLLKRKHQEFLNFIEAIERNDIDSLNAYLIHDPTLPSQHSCLAVKKAIERKNENLAIMLIDYLDPEEFSDLATFAKKMCQYKVVQYLNVRNIR